MAEYIRTVNVRVEVDTNKDTYTLDIENAGLPEILRQVEEFVEARFSATA